MGNGDPRLLDELLTHTAWVRRVAAALVRDGADGIDADDVVQAAWLAALTRPPAPDSQARAWLATVVRNFVRKRARDAARRSRRELDAPDDRGATPSPESLVERAELQQLLVAFVLELDEPFRSTLLLHYFEALAPAEIAARQGIPAATVRSRLKRGIDALRQRLDRAHGNDRRAWLAPVAALAGPRASRLPLLGKGLLVMKTKLTIGAAVAFVLAALLLAGGSVARHARAPAASRAAAAAPPAATHGAARAMRGTRAWADPLLPARAAIEGIVRGPDGKPLDGALVGAVPEDSDADELHVHAVAYARSSGGGHFRIAGLRPGAYAAQATAPGLSPAYRSGLVVLDGETVRGVELQLAAGGVTLVGELRDVGGGAIAGGRLHARRHGQEQPNVFTVVCDTDGACPITLARGGGYTLVAEAEGYAPAKREVVATIDQRVPLALTPAATLRGRVIDRRRHDPVPAARVALTMAGSFLADSQVIADDAGRFEFRDLPPGEYQLSAAKDERAGRAAAPVSIALGGYAGDVTIELAPARSIAGRVIGPSGPVAAARVLLRPARSTGNVIARVQSDANGVYRLGGLLPGAYQLRAESSPLAPALRDVVVGDEDVAGVDLQLAEGGTVDGVVLGRGRVPVADAVVSASVEDGEFRVTSAAARTGRDGRFHLGGLGAGLLSVTASHPDHGSGEAAPARLAVGEKKQVTLTLDAAASVDGTVVWDDGGPAVGVNVRAASSDDAPVSTQTGADGRYHLAPLAAGVHFVIASREPGAFAPREAGDRQRQAVTLAADEHKRGVDLVLLRGGHAISGRVIDPEGAPVADAMVRADAEDETGASLASGDPRVGFKKAVSGADGSFTIDDLTAGRYTLTASHEGFPAAVVAHVAADTRDARVQLARQATLEGVAVTADGRPVADYALTLFSSDATMMLAAKQLAVHDAGGAFALRGLGAGSYDLLAATADHRAGRLARIAVGEGERKTGLRIVVEPGTTLHGRVVEYGTGTPIPSAEVVVLSVGAPISTSTDARGAFSVAGLPSGRVAWIGASVDPRAYIYDRVRVTLPAGQDDVDAGTIQLVPGDTMAHGAAWTGIMPTNLDGVASVESVAPRSPAALAGVRPGDLLVRVDGVAVAGLGFRAIYHFLGGQPGSKVAVGLGDRTVVLTRVPDPN